MRGSIDFPYAPRFLGVDEGGRDVLNTIFRAGVPVAFIDWDTSAPGRRLPDLAYMAWTWCIQAQGNVPVRDQTVHLRELRDGYGPFDAGELLATGDLLNAVVEAQTGIVEGESAVIRDPTSSPDRRRHAHRAVEWADGDRKFVEQHRRDFLAS